MASETIYQTHIARDGERWDSLAFKYYGNAFSYPAILKENPSLLSQPTLNAGDIVQIPIIENNDETLSTTTNEDVPPWQR